MELFEEFVNTGIISYEESAVRTVTDVDKEAVLEQLWQLAIVPK